MLLCADGSFLQVMEGDKQSVETPFKYIERDPRHMWVARLRVDDVPKRTFPAWSIGWNSCNPDDEIAGLLRNIHQRSLAHTFAAITPEIEQLPGVFADRKIGPAAQVIDV